MHGHRTLVPFATAAAFAVVAACAGANKGGIFSGDQSANSPAWVQERAQGGSKAEQQVARTATEAQAGKLVEVRNDAIVLDPYQENAGNAEIALPNNAMVFRADQTVGRDQLRPGEDVNVYFDRVNGKPRALGIKILSTDEATKLQTAVRYQPRRG
ncbi:MAG TPA: hypothetical protein VG496_03915 [Myxococcales bacterium]|nr:hypothetical protein [Myxococcales bacterium]